MNNVSSMDKHIEESQSNIRLISLIIFITLYIVLAYVALQKPIEYLTGDYWMHAGSVTNFSENLTHPVSTYDEAEQIRVRNFSPYQLLLAASVKWIHITSNDAMALGACGGIGIIFFGLWLIGRMLSPNPWMPAGILLGVMFFVGTGFGWSGEVFANALPQFGGYPSTIATGLTLLCWYNADKLLSHFTWPRTALVSILVALVFLIHQLIFLYLFVYLFFWVSLAPHPTRNKLIVTAAFGIGLLLTIFWPYFNPFEVALAAVSKAEPRLDNVWGTIMPQHLAALRSQFSNLDDVLNCIGPAVFGLILLPSLPKNIRTRLSLLITATLILWFNKQAFHLPIPASGYRWAMASLLLLQFVVGINIARIFTIATIPGAATPKRIRYAFLGAAVLGAAIVSQAAMFKSSYLHYVWPRYSTTPSWTKRFTWFAQAARQYVKQEAIIAADPDTSYTMTAFNLSPAVFSRKRNPTSSLLLALYSKDTSLDQRRSILKELHAAYYILEPKRLDQEVVSKLSVLGQPIISKGGITLLRVTGEEAPL